MGGKAFGRVAAAAAAAALWAVVPAARASATGFNPNSFTVTTADPSGMAADGETVTVSGYYTVPGSSATATVTTYECLASAVGVGTPSMLDHTQCDPGNATVGVMPDPVAHAFTDYIVYDMTFTTTTGTVVNCGVTGTTCVIVGDVPPGDVMGEHDDDGEDACNASVFTPPQTGDITKQTSPAGGSTVSDGQAINVTLTFTGDDFDHSRNRNDDASDASDCIEVGGVVQKSRGTGAESWHERPGPGLGQPGGGNVVFTTSYTVPAGTPAGTQVCDRGVVSGVPAAGKWVDQLSNVVCFTVGPGAVVPESPWPVAMPAGAVVVGAGVWLARRRRAAA